MINAVGRELPEKIGNYIVRPYAGPQETVEAKQPVCSRRKPSKRAAFGTKLMPDLKAAILACGLKDGMTISFHHSFREGDQIIGQVLSAIKELGIKGLRFAPSAVVNIKNPSIVDFVKDGTIDRIQASGIRGELGDAGSGCRDRSLYRRSLAGRYHPLRSEGLSHAGGSYIYTAGPGTGADH